MTSFGAVMCFYVIFQKTIRVFENGQPKSAAKEITGRCLVDFLRKAAAVLGLTVTVKCFYALDGTRVWFFGDSVTGFSALCCDLCSDRRFQGYPPRRLAGSVGDRQGTSRGCR